MKIILSYLLICTYATVMIKPVMPTIADAFAHLLNYQQHKATVHHENGKYHVHYEYIEAAKRNSQENNPLNNLSRKADISGEHILISTQPDSCIIIVQQDHLSLLTPSLKFISLQAALRPPICLLPD